MTSPPVPLSVDGEGELKRVRLVPEISSNFRTP
jgi:hypothetical protein